MYAYNLCRGLGHSMSKPSVVKGLTVDVHRVCTVCGTESVTQYSYGGVLVRRRYTWPKDYKSSGTTASDHRQACFTQGDLT